MSTNWKKIAESLEWHRKHGDAIEDPTALIALCQRMASGELVERGPACTCGARHAPRCAARVHATQIGHMVTLVEGSGEHTGSLTGFTPTPSDESEREHCEILAHEMDDRFDLERREFEAVRDLLLSERAAVRAECQAQIKRLTARVNELEGQQTKQYGSYLRCRGYADCSADQRLAGCAECERVK